MYVLDVLTLDYQGKNQAVNCLPFLNIRTPMFSSTRYFCALNHDILNIFCALHCNPHSPFLPSVVRPREALSRRGPRQGRPRSRPRHHPPAVRGKHHAATERGEITGTVWFIRV